MIGSMLGRTCARSAAAVVVRRSAAGGARALAVTAPRALSTKAAAAATPASAAGGQTLKGLTDALPHLDVVRYEHKNRTWTLQHVHYYSEALAIGLTENGFTTGDVVLSWLPEHLSELMVLQFACSKAGFVLYNLDPSTASKDPEASKKALEAALTLTKANVFVSQEAGNDVNYITLAHAVIPELRIFDTSSGAPFVTPRFPHLRMCIHTGFDQDEKVGWYPLRHCIVPSDNLDSYVDTTKITAKTPLAGELKLDGKGIPTSVGPTLTNEQVVQKDVWKTYSAILKKQFHQVQGVGVIF